MKKHQHELLELIEKLWNKYPNQRFFQLLFNFTQLGTRTEIGTVKDPFFYSDIDILNQLKNETS